MSTHAGHWGRMLVGMLAAVAASAACSQTYRVTPLGALPAVPGSFSMGQGINNAGQIAGVVYGAGPRAALWTASTGWRDLGTLPGYEYSVAHALNDAGVVVGDTRLYGPGTDRAFRWTSGSGMRPLNPLPGDNGSYVHAVNAAGQAAGSSFWSDGSSTRERAAIWDAFGQPMPLPGGYIARGINDAGAVVGQTLTGEAFAWTPGTGMTSLAPPFSDALDINNAGMVTGSMPGDAFNVRLGFVWTAAGGLNPFPQPDGAPWTDPKALNDAGIVVGSFQFPGWRSFGFVWSQAAGVRPLEELIDPGDPLFGRAIYDAWAINDKGEITAQAILPDGSVGILLTPVPEPAAFALLATGLLVLGLRPTRAALSCRCDRRRSS